MIDKSKIADIYEKYAPKNITLQKFTEMVERDPNLLDSINGEFSTFDPELAKKFQNLNRKKIFSQARKNIFRKSLADSVDSSVINNIAEEYAKMYEEIICSDDKILEFAWTFDTLTPNDIWTLMMYVTRQINKRLGINNGIYPIIMYTVGEIDPEPESFGEATKLLKARFIKKFFPQARVGYAGVYDQGLITMSPTYDFVDFIAMLSHEYGHFIDDMHPSLGMLGAQTVEYGERVYSRNPRVYRHNPSEMSSFTIQHYVEDRIQKVLKEQADKKPELYIKSLQSGIDRMKLKIAASKVKKLFGRYTDPNWRILRKYERLLAEYKSKHNIRYVPQNTVDRR